MNVIKGDTVKIISGKDRGKTGKVLEVFPKMNRVAVEGINMYKKHARPKKQGEKGEIVNLIRPLHASNVQVLCSGCKKSSRVGHRIEGEKKVRFCKHCNASL